MPVTTRRQAATTNGKSHHDNDYKSVGGFNHMDWNSTFIQNYMIDPTRIFSILCIVIIISRYVVSENNNPLAAFTGFLLHPVVLGSCGIASFVWYLAKQHAPSKALPIYDCWVVEWYWWNAWLFHAVMDGASGTFHLVPAVVQQYFVLDKRFETHHTVPWLVGFIELVGMAPLCLMTLYAVRVQSPLRFPLEIVTSTFHAFGMLMFVFAEVYEGQLNVPALDPVGVPGNRWANVKYLDLYHLVYYWFGFWFCNLVWGFVPYYRIKRAVEECRASFEQTSKPNKVA